MADIKHAVRVCTVADDDVTLVVSRSGTAISAPPRCFWRATRSSPHAPNDPNLWNLGPGTELDEKTLEIDSAVNPVHDVIVTARLTGGPKSGTCVAKGATTHNPATVEMLIDFATE